MLAKWQAIPEPIIPDPITATFLIVRFILRFIFIFIKSRKLSGWQHHLNCLVD
jgi:hypothetical protein